MRYHSGGTDRAPWTVGEKADEVAKKYIQMLLPPAPLLYTLAWENHTLGMPMARRLDFYYPQYRGHSDTAQF